MHQHPGSHRLPMLRAPLAPFLWAVLSGPGMKSCWYVGGLAHLPLQSLAAPSRLLLRISTSSGKAEHHLSVEQQKLHHSPFPHLLPHRAGKLRAGGA